ncbi:MAG: hypothetical protein JJE03_00580 [Peptostreptococcaceae bacterium]|nr:hypothetical protein [Peptostreptococcaceae bacterium]
MLLSGDKMTDYELKILIKEALISIIARKVADKVMDMKKNALVVYTGSTINFNENLDELAKLKAEGFKFSLYMTNSAMKYLDKEKIINVLQPEKIITEQGDGEFPEKVAAQFDNFIVPAMTINTASKLAACMPDNWPARLLLEALMKDKNVVISTDGCCPDNPIREKLGYHMNQALKEKLRSNRNSMKKYGALLTVHDSLYADSVNLFLKNQKLNYTEDKKATSIMRQSDTGRTVIGSSLIISQANMGRIVIPKNAIVTALAVETASKNDIEIIRE